MLGWYQVEKIKKFTFLFLLISLFFFPNLAFPQKYPDYQDEEIKRLFFEGIDACFRENYPLAKEKFEIIVSKAPQDPAGYFFLAMLYQTQMIDYESYFMEKDFYENIKVAKKYAQERIKNNKKDPWGYLFLGNAYGAKAFYDAKKGNWWSGLNSGLKAKSALKEAVKCDPELYDAYAGLGSYHYWASVVTKVLWWLPFIGDKRQQGITEMKLAQERSVFSQDAATNGLIWMYINEKKIDQAIDLAKRMQNKYPEGKSFLWALAEAYYEKPDWSNALSCYQEILERVENQIHGPRSGGNHGENPSSHYNWIECKFCIANCLFNLERFNECVLICEEMQSHPLDERTKDRQKDKLKNAKRLLERSLQYVRKTGEK